MKKYVVERDNGKSFIFNGELLYQQKNGLASVLGVYKTTGGNYICYKSDVNCNYKQEAEVCKNHDEIIEFFGHNDESRKLYKKLNIDYYIEVE